MRNLIITAFIVAFLGAAWAGPYQANYDSLKKHEDAPEWFRDAKLGIYFHWGVYAVPAFGSEWYPRNMFLKGNSVNKHHIETYGDPAQYGYDRFVDQWKTSNFHAREWAKLFRQTGARFAGPVAEHHDGFSLWNSDVTPWNAVDKGPKRDLVGELAKAIRAEGMKVITTFHHARNHYGHFDGMKKDYPKAMADPEVAFLYGQMSPEKFHDVWLTKLKEVIDQYQPDIIWFDSWLDRIPESYRQAFCAYYLNEAAKWEREVVIVRKQNDLPIEFTVNDHEKSRESKASPRVWMTDDTISTGSWCFTRNLRIKPTSKVVHALVDTVAKNGVVLLNISPMADGTIPADQQNVLRELGQWMKINGEAIYATRPWQTFGEGPTMEPEGGFSDHSKFLKLEYSGKDIRYTQSKDGKSVYAITCGWPGSEAVLSAVKVVKARRNATVHLIGYPTALKHSTNDKGRLVIHLPALAEGQRPGQHAYSFKLTGFDLKAVTPARHVKPITLSAEKALLDGSKLALETKTAGRANVGFWDNAQETIHWLVKIPSPGTYALQGEFATTSETNSLTVAVAGQTRSFSVPNTGGWNTPRTVKTGTISFAKPGVYHLILSPKARNWSAVNLWNLQLTAAE
jgi:alpha-L-fucosidase